MEEVLHRGKMFSYRNRARSTDQGRSGEGARSRVVAAKGDRSEEPVIDLSGPVGRIARYAWSDHYAALRLGLESVAAVLRAHGWKARIAAAANALVDRAAPHRAGLGWWGKNANPLLPPPASWYVLASRSKDRRVGKEESIT